MRARSRGRRPTVQAIAVTGVASLLVVAVAVPARAEGSIAGFSPTHGPEGTEVAISGTGFGGAVAVRFNGAEAAFAVESDELMTAIVPAGATTGPIEVETADGPATSSEPFVVEPTPGPTIASFSPARGPEHATVDVEGSGFLDTTEVRFAGVVAEYAVHDDAHLTAEVPAGADRGPISVTSAAGTATSVEPFIVQPNVVILMTDDQRHDAIAHMPVVTSELVGKGVSFSNGFVSNPLCCPSRVALLTGQYSHSNGVYSNVGDHGGFGAFRGDDSTIATWLDGVGYETALVGKYLNGYGPDNAYVPPGWDRWVAFNEGNGAYYDYGLRVDDATVAYGNDAADYSTDVLAGFADEFIRATPEDEPLFLYFAPFAPHGPATPPARYAGAFSSEPGPRPPSYNEQDVSDKPSYIRNMPPLSAKKSANMDAHYRRVLETLLAVDSAVGSILRALSDTERLSNTLILYLSDNGIADGEHRWGFKVVPYEESIRVPFIVRWDRLSGVPRTESGLAMNIDVAPTVAAVADAASPQAADGRSLMPLLTGSSSPWRGSILLESLEYRRPDGSVVPSYCGVRTRSRVFVRYATGEEEYYTLATDPYQLKNKAKVRSAAAAVGTLRDQARAMCDPLPPGMPAF